ERGVPAVITVSRRRQGPARKPDADAGRALRGRLSQELPHGPGGPMATDRVREWELGAMQGAGADGRRKKGGRAPRHAASWRILRRRKRRDWTTKWVPVRVS